MRCIMKTGDDLRQDAIVMQFVRIMDHFWRQQGLDLNMITFKIVPSGKGRAPGRYFPALHRPAAGVERLAGLIELVPNARTLREIHTARGATGSFLDKVGEGIVCRWPSGWGSRCWRRGCTLGSESKILRWKAGRQHNRVLPLLYAPVRFKASLSRTNLALVVCWVLRGHLYLGSV